MTATPPRLVGRDQPLAELQALVAAALASRGGLVTLTGEAGIGKTALATAAADHAEERGATVAWGACWEGARPLWPWLEVLAALGARVDLQGGERLRPPSAAAARFERFSAVSGVLLEVAGSRPLVVVLDDLHWADPASVELAAFHARRARRSRQLLVVTYRDVEVAPGDPLAGPLSRLAAEGGTLPLGGLDARPVAVLLAGITGGDPDPELGAGVRRRTGGNPFLVQQVARLLAAHPDAAAVPLGARDAIRRRPGPRPGRPGRAGPQGRHRAHPLQHGPDRQGPPGARRPPRGQRHHRLVLRVRGRRARHVAPEPPA
jgi:predicted ATPase